MTRPPVTLWLGAGLIIVCQALLAVDVARRGAAVLPPDAGQLVVGPHGALEHTARWVSVNMTPLCWSGYLLLADGILVMLCRRRGGPACTCPTRSRPRRFVTAFVTGIGVWSFFDWVNFSFIHAWDYYGLQPLGTAHVLIAKFVAFGAISPAMFMAAEIYEVLGLRRLRGTPLRIGRAWLVVMAAIGVAALAFPFIVRDPVGSLTLWVSIVLVLDPINYRLGGPGTPTLIGDLGAGRWGRPVALMLGGLTCGFLWEFWNYWAAAKWTYDLPFLGPLEHVKLFEMPIPGFAGFLPFALECWVVFQSIVLVMNKLGLRFVEPLPDADAVL